MHDYPETLYDTLEVSHSASQEVIRAAYRLLIQRYHPDRNPADQAAADRCQRCGGPWRLFLASDMTSVRTIAT